MWLLAVVQLCLALAVRGAPSVEIVKSIELDFTTETPEQSAISLLTPWTQRHLADILGRSQPPPPPRARPWGDKNYQTGRFKQGKGAAVKAALRRCDQIQVPRGNELIVPVVKSGNSVDIYVEDPGVANFLRDNWKRVPTLIASSAAGTATLCKSTI